MAAGQGDIAGVEAALARGASAGEPDTNNARYFFFFSITLEPRVEQSMSLTYEPSSELRHISSKPLLFS